MHNPVIRVRDSHEWIVRDFIVVRTAARTPTPLWAVENQNKKKPDCFHYAVWNREGFHVASHSPWKITPCESS